MSTINRPKRKTTYIKHTDLSKIYNCTEWKNLRKYYYTKQPLCEFCLEEGKLTPTKEIHHIIPISTGNDELEQKDLLLNENNLVALCVYHHHEVHNKMRKGKTI